MSNRSRISLLIIANLLVPIAFFMALSLLDICFYSASDELDYNALTLFCLLSVMGMSLLSFILSKGLPKSNSQTSTISSRKNRFFLFLIFNLFVPIAFFSALDLWDIPLYSEGEELNYNALTVFCLLSGMGMALLSLALSKILPKHKTRTRVIKPSRASNSDATICHIVLVRHGEADWNDASLNEEGKKQAKELAELLSLLPVTTIYTAFLFRSIETAKILAEPHEDTLITSDSTLEFKRKKYKILDVFLSKQHKKERMLKESTEEATIYLQKMAREHVGETIFVVTEGRVIKSFLQSLGEISTDLENTGAACIASNGNNLWVTELKKEKLVKNSDQKLLKALLQGKKNAGPSAITEETASSTR